MEGQVARRRISTIAGHLLAGDEMYSAAAAAHVVPLNKEVAALSWVMSASALMAIEEKPLTFKTSNTQYGRELRTWKFLYPARANLWSLENCSAGLNPVTRRCDNRIYFARQGSSSQGSFMRQASIDQARRTQPGTCQGSCNASEAPLFSRPSRTEQKLPNFGIIQPRAQCCNFTAAEPAPRFARPDRRMSRQKQSNLKETVQPPNSRGAKWSPRMDVVESERNYVLNVEVPGVSSKDIRVEVSDQKLTVMGMRQAWKVPGFSNESIVSYHKREIAQGPYQIAWPLPTNVNKDSVSAEFVEGFLQIIVPKL